jgi:penicillin-binding protein-related factor A (putative recombinase)
MVRGRETQYISSIVTPAIEALGGWAYKIPDPDTTSGQPVKSAKRPFDVIACVDGITVGIEVKQQQRYESFGCYSDKWVKPHQVAGLQAVARAGGIGLVMLIVRAYGQRRLYVWTIEELLAVGRNVTKSELMNKIPYLLPSKGVYNIEPWLRSGKQ